MSLTKDGDELMKLWKLLIVVFLCSLMSIFSGCNDRRYTVNFLDYDGNILKSVLVRPGDEATPPEIDSRDGFSFLGWDKDYTDIQENLNIRPVFSVISHTVNFYDDDDTLIKTERVRHGENANPPEMSDRSGNRFAGWDIDYHGVVEDLNIRAVYEKSQFTITFDTNGGSEIPPLTGIEYNTSADLSAWIPEKPGYLFLGWYVSNEPEANLFTGTNPITADFTLYARWRIVYLQYYIENNEEHRVIIHSYQGADSEVVIPDYIEGCPVAVIDANAFFGNSTIENLVLPKTIQEIGDHAFSEMTALRSIAFPNATYTLGAGILLGAEKLESVTLPGTYPLSSYFANSPESVPETLTEVIVTPGTTEIANEFLCDIRSMTSVSLPREVSVIGQYSFANTSIRMINLSENSGLTKIGNYAFSGTEKLESIVLPAALSEIGNFAFARTSKLTSITFPDSLSSIGDYAFMQSGLTALFLPSGVQSLGKGAFKEVMGIREIVFPEGITDVSDELFQNAENLETVVLAPLTERIGKNAFSGCMSLSALEFPETLKIIDDYALASVSITRITLPGSLERIGNYAFTAGRLLSVQIPDSVQSIGYGGFSSCELLSVSFSEKTKLRKIEAQTFAGCRRLKMVEIPSGITEIGESAFSGDQSLISIFLPDTVTVIKAFAFMGCVSLPSVTIPASVTSIGGNAFQDASMLISVTISRKTQDGITKLGKDAFSGTSGELKIYVSQGSETAYKDAENWFVYRNRIYPLAL